MALNAETLLAIVAVINAAAAAIALIIHALRVPYRESDKAEDVHALAQNLKLRSTYPPEPPPLPPHDDPLDKTSGPMVP